MASKRKHEDAPAAEDADPIDPSEEFMFLALGGGNEVGRSCHIIKYKGKTVMVCAAHGSSRDMRHKLTEP